MTAAGGTSVGDAVVKLILAGPGRELKIAARGRSMGMLFREGCTIRIRGCNGDYRIGDIIVYRDSSGWIVHRVVKVTPAGNGLAILTKGDCNRLPDETIGAGDEAVLGKVVTACGQSGQMDFLLRWNRWMGIMTAAASYAEGRANLFLVRNTRGVRWMAAAAVSLGARRVIGLAHRLLVKAAPAEGRAPYVGGVSHPG